MWRFTPYVVKSLWRNRARTALTVGGAAVALFVFCAVGAVQEGLARLTTDGKNETTLIVFQANRFCPSTSRLPEDYAGIIAKVHGVRDVVPIKVFLNNCRATLDAVVFNGIPAEKLRTARDLKIVEGDPGDFEKRRDGALVGQALAKRRGLQAGQRFSIGEVAVTVSGIFQAANAAEENFLYVHLDFLQRARGINSVGSVTQFEVHLAEGTNALSVCRDIDAELSSRTVATATRPKGVFEANAVGDLVELVGFARYLGFACVGLVLALVATTTVMAVQDRVREHAVLQTLGFSPSRVFSFVLAESMIVGVVGGLLGIGAALGVLAWTGMTIGAEGVTIAFVPSPRLAVTGLLVATAVGVVAGLVPAWRAARAEIVTSLRAV